MPADEFVPAACAVFGLKFADTLLGGPQKGSGEPLNGYMQFALAIFGVSM